MKERRRGHPVVIIASAGGHLYEALRATSSLRIPPLLITYKARHLQVSNLGKEFIFITHPRGNVIRLAVNVVQSLIHAIRLRPRVVITTGADVAVPFCIFSKLLGSKLIYIESGANICTPTRTGKLLHPFADHFFVQWESVAKHFSKAIVGGPLL